MFNICLCLNLQQFFHLPETKNILVDNLSGKSLTISLACVKCRFFLLVFQASRGPLTQDSLLRVEECSELQGTGAIVMLLPALSIVEPGPEEQDVPLLSALLQLKQLQQANTWHCPLPLVILVPGPDGGTVDTQKLEEGNACKYKCKLMCSDRSL